MAHNLKPSSKKPSHTSSPKSNAPTGGSGASSSTGSLGTSTPLSCAALGHWNCYTSLNKTSMFAPENRSWPKKERIVFQPTSFKGLLLLVLGGLESWEMESNTLTLQGMLGTARNCKISHRFTNTPAMKHSYSWKISILFHVKMLNSMKYMVDVTCGNI